MDYTNLVSAAHEAGMAAGSAFTPTPMYVVERDIFGRAKPGAPVECVADGPCGCAWIWFKGNTDFSRWAKKKRLARESYPTGFQIYCHEFNQSMERKEAYARAYAKVLQEAGIKCHAGSRLY